MKVPAPIVFICLVGSLKSIIPTHPAGLEVPELVLAGAISGAIFLIWRVCCGKATKSVTLAN
jgi:hypothetical protein